MITLREAWTGAKARLQSVSSSASLDAQVLLADVIGAADRAYLFAHPEQALTAEQQARYESAIQRREIGEPVAYIRGFKDWYDRQIAVTSDVLIPRPETELLLETALEWANARTDLTVADIGTGSGAIAVTLQSLVPHAVVYGTDISPAALDVAKRNAATYGSAVQWLYGDLLAPLIERGIQVDLLVSNPPYIAAGELPALAVSRYEPGLALDGGVSGLDLIERLLAGAPQMCNPGALILIEIGADQGEAVLALAHQYLNLKHAEICKDYAGLDRYLKAVLQDAARKGDGITDG